MGNSSSRQYTYQQYYSAIKQSGNLNQINFKNIDVDTLDPYEVLNVSKKFTWNELKDSYRKLAINTHPDKEGGNAELFDIITKCFTKLAQEYKNRQNDKQHDELKRESNSFYDRFDNEKQTENKNNSKDINTELFNKNFEKCKLYDEETEFGYGSLMQESSKIRDDINIEKIIEKGKMNNENFNQIFNKNVPISKQVVRYKEPEPLILAKTIQFTELGGKKPDDYTSSMEQCNKLAYTDYMKAHDGSRLVDPDIIKNRKDFKSVEEFEKYRNSKIKKGLSTREKKLIEDSRMIEEKNEFDRLERLKKYDINIEKSYNKANKLFLH